MTIDHITFDRDINNRPFARLWGKYRGEDREIQPGRSARDFVEMCLIPRYLNVATTFGQRKITIYTPSPERDNHYWMAVTHYKTGDVSIWDLEEDGAGIRLWDGLDGIIKAMEARI